ncbi:MAG TPA: ferredoxin [Acidimicrobiales bacterium]|nr:ferredoxin [Acidimicrobiales bacterium]
MIVDIDDHRCRGHAVCCSICPDLFTLTEDGYAAVRSTEVPPDVEAAARSALRQCPERANSSR